MSDEKQQREPVFCPRCGMAILEWMWECPNCCPEAYGEQYRAQAEDEEE